MISELAFPSRTLAGALVCSLGVVGAEVALGQPAVDGTWSTILTARDDPRWRIVDHLCGICSPETYEHLENLVANPDYDDVSLREIQEEARSLQAERRQELLTEEGRQTLVRPADLGDTSLVCEPPSLFGVVIASPLPVRIETHSDRVIIHQQDWNVVRTISLVRPDIASNDGSERYGTSMARFDDESLVIETENIPSMVLQGPTTTERARMIERYTPSSDGQRLGLEVMIEDEAIFEDPIRFFRPRLRTSDVQIIEVNEGDECAALAEINEGETP